jgi:hypothetical protein
MSIGFEIRDGSPEWWLSPDILIMKVIDQPAWENGVRDSLLSQTELVPDTYPESFAYTSPDRNETVDMFVNAAIRTGAVRFLPDLGDANLGSEDPAYVVTAARNNYNPERPFPAIGVATWLADPNTFFGDRRTFHQFGLAQSGIGEMNPWRATNSFFITASKLSPTSESLPPFGFGHRCLISKATSYAQNYESLALGNPNIVWSIFQDAPPPQNDTAQRNFQLIEGRTASVVFRAPNTIPAFRGAEPHHPEGFSLRASRLKLTALEAYQQSYGLPKGLREAGHVDFGLMPYTQKSSQEPKLALNHHQIKLDSRGSDLFALIADTGKDFSEGDAAFFAIEQSFKGHSVGGLGILITGPGTKVNSK